MGGGGGDNGYSAKQAQTEAEKAQAREALNATFGTAESREPLYQSVRDNAYTAGKRGIDEQNDTAGRNLKFELFAKGLNGGSEDINQNALRERTYNNGLLDLGGKADAAKAGFKADDESTRLNLLQSIDAGMDQSSALSSSVNQLSNNAAKANAEAQGTTLGDLFSNTALISNQSQYRQGKAAGTDWWNNYNPAGSSGARTATGTVTRV